MKSFSASFVALAVLLAGPVIGATVPVYGQCGGTAWNGGTVCASGSTCQVINSYYSQCLPGSSTSSPPSTSTPTSTTTAPTTKPTTTSTSPTTTSSGPASPTATGFVKTSGQKFTLNNTPFTVVGENSYWVGLMGYSTTQMNQAFSDIAKTGATVVRTWGFNEVTSPSGIYYQSWSGSKPTINTGATGLGNFDNVVAAAKANGLRLIVALTNNWKDYGGMDVYTQAIAGSSNHDLFYTNANIIAAYKNYISAFVGRYKNEPTIMAWELANEPRCTNGGASTGTCTAATITSWAKTISAYIKSIDSNHLVALGDEGFYNRPGQPYPNGGSDGVDFDANLMISSLDFGTLHLYPESWTPSSNAQTWGLQYIQNHTASQIAANKPVILEEFGVTNANQVTTYTAWFNEIVSAGLTGDLIWQAGSHFSTGSTPNDGYAVYPDGPVYPLITSHAAALKKRD